MTDGLNALRASERLAETCNKRRNLAICANFNNHGGEGAIVLGREMEAFLDRFRLYGEDVTLTVDYGHKSQRVDYFVDPMSTVDPWGFRDAKPSGGVNLSGILDSSLSESEREWLIQQGVAFQCSQLKQPCMPNADEV